MNAIKPPFFRADVILSASDRLALVYEIISARFEREEGKKNTGGDRF